MKIGTAVVVMCLAVPMLGQRPSVPPVTVVPSARYQIVTGESGKPSADLEKVVFLIDTQEGTTWLYQASFVYTDSDGKQKAAPAVWVEVKH